jgi:hypothetical protein
LGRGGSGFGATWSGNGIASSTAAEANAIEPEVWSVGYAENAALPLGAYTSFRGVAVDETAVLIAYMRTGDANLDGVVNDDDVTIVGANYAPGVVNANWALGDFDYNGFVGDDDVTLLGAFYEPGTAGGPPVEAKYEAQSTNYEGGVERRTYGPLEVRGHETGAQHVRGWETAAQPRHRETRALQLETRAQLVGSYDAIGENKALVDLLAESIVEQETGQFVGIGEMRFVKHRIPQAGDRFAADWRIWQSS